ncbi:MAG: SsrA-binding protein SmpB [Acidimicrobiales bacterium]
MAPKRDGTTSGAGNRSGEVTKVVASNRKARHDYEILDVIEAGIALVGTEVKSCRAGQVVLKDAYARVEGGEVWLFNAHIAPFGQADGFGGHEPERRRKLLVHRRQAEGLAVQTQQQSLTLIPLSVYLRDGRVKVELAVGRGRRSYDKRQAIAEHDAKREADRDMARARRR